MVALVVVAVACGTAGDMVGEILDSGVPDAGAQPGDGSSMQYVGNSAEAFQWRDSYVVENETIKQGIFTYYAACQDTFGPGHRMCTGDEILYTTKIPQLNEGLAWYGPDTACGGQFNRHSAVNEVGGFEEANCETSGTVLPIACCGPK